MHGKTLCLRAGVFLLAVMMTASLITGCKSETKTAYTPDTKAIESEPDTISFLAAEYDSQDYFKKGIAAFEEKYNKKVEILKAVGEELYSEKVAAQIAAKDPIDVFYIKIDQYLTMYNRNFLTPLNDYVNVDAEGNNIETMDRFTKFDGKYYASGLTAIPYVLYYNKGIMEANGFDADEPLNRYNEGTWNWESFVELARECNDAESGITGIENMFDEAFLASNGASAVKFENGQYSLNIKTDAMRTTLNFVQDIFKNNKVCGAGYVTGQNKFLMGKSAMHGAYAYEEGESFSLLKEEGSIKFDYGVAPFPSGPDNKDNVVFGHSSGFAISNGSKAPNSAGALIDCIVEARNESDAAANKRLLSGSAELYSKLSKNLFATTYTDGILDKGHGSFYLLYYVRQGEDINKVLSEYETNYSKMVKDANDQLTKSND